MIHGTHTHCRILHRVDYMWEEPNGQKMFHGRWFYRYEDLNQASPSEFNRVVHGRSRIVEDRAEEQRQLDMDKILRGFDAMNPNETENDEEEEGKEKGDRGNNGGDDDDDDESTTLNSTSNEEPADDDDELPNIPDDPEYHITDPDPWRLYFGSGECGDTNPILTIIQKVTVLFVRAHPEDAFDRIKKMFAPFRDVYAVFYCADAALPSNVLHSDTGEMYMATKPIEDPFIRQTVAFLKKDRLSDMVEEPLPTLRAFELFAGMGGLTLGLHAANIETHWALELDEAPADAFEKTFPETTLFRANIIVFYRLLEYYFQYLENERQPQPLKELNGENDMDQTFVTIDDDNGSVVENNDKLDAAAEEEEEEYEVERIVQVKYIRMPTKNSAKANTRTSKRFRKRVLSDMKRKRALRASGKRVTDVDACVSYDDDDDDIDIDEENDESDVGSGIDAKDNDAQDIHGEYRFQLMFKVHWEGYSSDDDSWVGENDFGQHPGRLVRVLFFFFSFYTLLLFDRD